MRLPSGPGYGGKSSPSASRPSFTHCTVRAIIALLEKLAVDLRLPLVIVERLFLPRQVRDCRRMVAALEEPLRRSRREDEELGELQLARTRFDLRHQRLAVALAPEIRMHGERGELARFILGKGIQAGA